MAVPAWAVHQLQVLLPLEERELEQILSYSASLPKEEASQHLQQLLGDTPAGAQFIAAFNERGAESDGTSRTQPAGSQGAALATPQQPYSANPSNTSAAPANHLRATSDFDQDIKTNGDSKTNGQAAPPPAAPPSYAPPAFAPPTGAPPSGSISRARTHSNVVIEAARIRARDEQEMQNALQRLQFQYGIYNSDIEPEHETDYPCSCAIHQYQYRKWARYAVQEQWSKAVMYPGEKAYNDSYNNPRAVGTLFSHNPYRFRVVSPYGYGQRSWYGFAKPIPSYHARAVHQTISLNNELNREAQQKIDAQEPKHSIWDDDPLAASLAKLAVGDHKAPIQPPASEKSHAGPSDEKRAGEKSGLSGDRRPSAVPSASEKKASKFASFRQSIGIKSSEERSVAKAHKAAQHGSSLRAQIEAEENGRWPDEQWRYVVAVYQDKVGMAKMIADLRAHKPIQYLHLLRAGYFEPIPVAWANQDSNPLKFSIEAAAGWRGITPAWRGYEDTAEERLYWVLNHREGSVGMRMKPDQISELNMANERMARAVEPPPMYFDPNDTCHLQHTSEGYSKQVMPAPFRPFDRPESANDDSIILLDVSGSMDFDPVRPVYDQYMITRYMRSTQPKNKGMDPARRGQVGDADIVTQTLPKQSSAASPMPLRTMTTTVAAMISSPSLTAHMSSAQSIIATSKACGATSGSAAALA